MKDLNKIGEELFSKLRGRFKNITIGNEEGITTNDPAESRFYEFTYGDQGGKVSVSLDEDSVVVMYSENLFDSNNASMKTKWYDFLKEIRVFAKKRMLNFEVRDIQKSNLEKRDYKFLSNKNGDNTMTESTMYGTSKTSYQNIADARICVKHSENINQELAGGRSQKIGSIYIESANGERFKYPYKHLNGARAMAMHVAEGGNMYDDFGKHIVGLSEEMNKLRKFKTYMSRSSVMAEGLADYMDVVNERIETVKNTVAKLQNKKYYKEATENFQSVVLEEVPEDVATDWTAQLTIKQFNEELKSVFPYIYKLVSEANKVKELGPEDLLGEELKDKEDYQAKKKALQDIQMDPNTHKDEKLKKELMRRKAELDDQGKSAGYKEADSMGMNKYGLAAEKKGDKFISYRNGEKTGEFDSMEELSKHQHDLIADESTIPTEADIDAGFEEMMGQFAEKSKPDYIDIDGDGDKKEPMKKAVDDKEKGDDEEETNEDMEKDEVMAIMAKHPQDVERMKKAGEINMASGLYTALFRYYQEEMPYGTQKARDGDPHEFIMDKLDALDLVDEGNAFAHAVRKAKMDGKKKGDKIDHPDDDEEDITLEKEQKMPLPEKILSLFDRETGAFPKGETAVLTMVEKDYGEKFIEPAKQFIEKIMQKYEDVITGPAVQEMEAEHEPGKVTLAVTADINALKRAAGIEETKRTVSTNKDLLNIKALAGL